MCLKKSATDAYPHFSQFYGKKVIKKFMIRMCRSIEGKCRIMYVYIENGCSCIKNLKSEFEFVFQPGVFLNPIVVVLASY